MSEHPEFAIIPPFHLHPEGAEAFRKEWERAGREGKAVVLPHGTQFIDLRQKPLLIPQRANWWARLVCRIFGHARPPTNNVALGWKCRRCGYEEPRIVWPPPPPEEMPLNP